MEARRRDTPRTGEIAPPDFDANRPALQEARENADYSTQLQRAKRVSGPF